jgi:PST family polysaccharide transporter
MAWLLVTAPQLVVVVFGPKWVSAIVLVQILAFLAIPQSIGTNTGWIYLSQGRTDIMFRWGIFSTSMYLISFAVGLRWGVEGVALAYTITSLALTYPAYAIVFPLIDLKKRYFLAQLQSIILATLTLGIIASLTSISLEKLGVTQDPIILAIVILASLLSYSVVIFVLDRELFKESVRLLGHLISTNGE